MAGLMDRSYVKSNSIHHSFQRAVVVHGSHHAQVVNNVAYITLGHSYFVEDGAETQNVLEANLGAITLRSIALLASDMKPATFWTSTPSNVWRNNVAAGSVSFGYVQPCCVCCPAPAAATHTTTPQVLV